MKKKIILAVAFLLAVGVSSGVYAAVTDYTANLSSIGLPGKLSTNVVLAYGHSTDQSGYVAGTYHLKGTKSFASSSGDSAIFASEVTAFALPDAPTGTATAGFASGWTAL